MSLPVDKAIQRLKTEIIAPDWRISPRRIEALEAAFVSLGGNFQHRQGMKAILTMAGNILQYLKVKGDGSLPESIDFLKEAMAGIITIHEEIHPDPDQEKKAVDRLLARFQKLKGKIKAPAMRQTAVSRQESADPGCSRAAAGTAAEWPEASAPEGQPPGSERKGPPAADRQQQEITSLMVELENLLLRAETVGANLRRLLEKARTIAPGSAGPLSGDLPAAGPAAAPASRQRQEPPIRECPPTTLREVVVNGQALAIPEEGVALVRPLATAAREKYLRDRQVSLRDFQRVFHGLAHQFRGVLAEAGDRKLREVVLPLISLQAFGFSELPDKQASTLLVLSHGNWHGVLLCGSVRDDLRTMLKFQKVLNGDLGGNGFLDEGGELPVINLREVLRREGFLLL